MIAAWLAFAWATPARGQSVQDSPISDPVLANEPPIEEETRTFEPSSPDRETPARRLALPANLSAVIDVRMVLTDGERSFTDAGFGRSRFGGDSDLRFVPATAALFWHGPIAWNLSGTFSVAYQDEQDFPVDLIEAYATWRPVPRGPTRFAARAGLFWPPVSREHEGPAWTATDMITPSAINSWIGEEVKVVGIEGLAAHDVGGGEISATLGLFGFNDTAGTLLAFRGWALHDQTAGAFSRQPLPPFNDFIRFVQPQWTTPALEADGRPGFYARLAWHGAPVSLDAFYYANGGDPESVTSNLQWGWDTRFLNLGARIELGRRTRLIAQALAGTTEMGFPDNGALWVDTRFRSAYLRLTHEVGPVALSGRLDLFDARQRGGRVGDEDNDKGWGLTGAARWRVSSSAQLIVEWLHVDSERAARARSLLAPVQRQNVVQAALRLSI